MKEKTINRTERLVIVVVLLLFVAFVAWIASLGMVNSTDDPINEPRPNSQRIIQLSDDAVEKRLVNILTDCGIKVKKVEVSGGVVWIDLYHIGSWPDYQKKQLIVTLTELAHQERKGSGGTNVYLYDEYGVKIASARHHSIDNTVKDVKLY